MAGHLQNQHIITKASLPKSWDDFVTITSQQRETTTNTSSIPKYRFGLPDWLMSILLSLKPTTNTYTEYLLDTEDFRLMKEHNIWLKEVNGRYVLKDNVDNTFRGIKYRKIDADSLEDLKSYCPIDISLLKRVAEFQVQRRVYEFMFGESVLKLAVDVSIFPEKDNHLICSLSISDSSVSEALQHLDYEKLAASVYCVRSKIFELMYRYHPSIYNDISKHLESGVNYEPSYLESLLLELSEEEVEIALRNIAGKKFAPTLEEHE